jgi:replication factor C subunit 2/4
VRAVLQPADVMEVAGVIPPERIAHLLQSVKGTPFRTLQSAAQEMIYSAYPVDAVLAQFSSAVLRDVSIGDGAKAKIAVRIAEAEHKLIDGADELLQLLDVMSFTAQAIAANA